MNSQETVTTNAQGDVEKRIETIDYRSSAGQGQEMRNVQVIHQSNPNKEKSNTSGGVLSNAAASVASTLQSAKEAISRNSS
ncbi:uncharacterized protein LOC8285587 isoform X2 [Ricinus communis]|uniref:uncharacterized protein LOC8285587 isoform X2 n=1 Tax=Ricinus communis TaxID=3988 RepID=UPI00077251FC|nr:uncharacterized protein LOC8285587 isoform X2 [Ricinus communis]|eukprot:XP_015578301.1 uncharacterized protein LOC8285587 isoform X2 [Ricinus communis]